MSRSVLSVLAVVSLVPVAAAQRQRQSRPAPVKLDQFTTEEQTVSSPRLKRGDAAYTIYLPKGYADEANKDKKYPMVVWLHGFGGPTRFGESGGADVLNSLRGGGKIPELLMVVLRVSASGGGRRGGGGSVYLNGEAAGDTEDFIVKDLVAHVQGKYRVAEGASKHALMGESMGGMGALKIAMHHPDVFGAVAAHSSAILPADPAELPNTRYARQAEMMVQNGLDKVFGNPIDKDKWAKEMPMGIVATSKPEDFKGLKIYFDAGTEDRYGFAEPNQELDQAMTKKGIGHVFRLVKGGGHAWGSPSMKENLVESLQFVGAVFAGKDPVKAAQEAAADKVMVDKTNGAENKGEKKDPPKEPVKDPPAGEGKK
jgi:S-formylglutathione hydrolase FrmB